MAYTFEMIISGIIAVVKQDGGKRLRIVVPNTLLGKATPGSHLPEIERKAVDDENDLYRHDPTFNSHGGPRIPLRGYSMSFALPGGEPQELGAVQGHRLPSMSEAVGGLANADCVLARPFADAASADPVSAVLDISMGVVETLSCGTAQLNQVDGTDGLKREMAHALKWSVSGLVAPPTLFLVDFEGAPVLGPLPLLVDAKGVARGALMNHRAHRGEYVEPSQRDDYDFRWYYELLGDQTRNEVNRALKAKGTHAPVPVQQDKCEDSRMHTMTTGGQLCRPCEFCGPD